MSWRRARLLLVITALLGAAGQAMAHTSATSHWMLAVAQIQPRGIPIVQAPQWWSSSNALFIGGGLIFALAIALVWIRLLRHQLCRQRRELEQEIAQHKRTEAALQASDQFLRSLVENLPLNISRKDLQGRITFANQVFARTVGKPIEEIIGKTDFDLFPKELAAKYGSDDEKVLSSGKPFETVEENRNARGEKIHVQVTKTPLFDAEDRPLGVQIAFWDVTARREAEAELAHERDLFRTMLDNLPDSIYFKDKESRFVRVGRAKLEKSFEMALSLHRASAPAGADRELPPHLRTLETFAAHLTGMTDFDFFAEPHARKCFAEEQEIIRSGQPVLGRLERLTQLSSKETWCLTTKMPWLDKEGNIIGTFGISHDVTSIKEAEAKLEAVHKQLMETSRQAGMAEVATSVLHNVGNVLNSINVSTSLLEDKIKNSRAGHVAKIAEMVRAHEADLANFLCHDPKGKQLTAYVAQLGEHLAAEQAAALGEVHELVSHIKHIKEIVATQQSYARISGVVEAVQPTDLIEDALRINAAALERHGVVIRREYSPALPEIVVEKHKVLQILVNLIRNAKYACDDSTRAAKQVSLQLANGDGRIRISVTDNGVGIAPENLTRIFNHGFTTRKHGHGFGLHSGALAAKEMGGTLSVHSEGPNQGATFTLELPVAPATN